MVKSAAARILFLTLMCASCGTWAAAQALRQPLEQAAAREVKLAHPPGCLAAWPIRQTLTGRLLGIVVPAFPDENPPVPAKAFLFLLLDRPISVCAAPGVHYPAYEDVTRVKIVNLSLSDFFYVIRTWGPSDIRITSTLNTEETLGQVPGPVIFESANFRFCWRPASRAARHAASSARDLAPGWKCAGSGEWFKLLPGPHLP